MRQAEFTVDIVAPTAREFSIGGNNYVALPNMTQYSIAIHNNHHTRCDAEVHVNGEVVGQWVVQAHSSVTIDRPAGIARRFTFVDETGGEMNGVVSVIFKPAKEKDPIMYASLSSLRSGVTVSGDTSTQRFISERALTNREIDWHMSTEVRLRLVVEVPPAKRLPYPQRLD